jgi:hypothetical protein
VAKSQGFEKQLKQLPSTQDTSKQKIKLGDKTIIPVKVEDKKPTPALHSGQIPFNIGNEDIQAMIIPKSPVFVTNEFKLVLKDNSTKICRRGHGKNSFDIIKKSNGGYVLAYLAETENQSIYAKGVMFNLGNDLKQTGFSTIFTSYEEDISRFVITESIQNQIELAYLCKVATSYDVYKQPINPKTILKQSVFVGGSPIRNVKVDEHPTGAIDLVGISKGNFETRVFYNKEGKGKIGLIYGNTGNFNCDIQSIGSQESFGGSNLIQADIKSFRDFGYNILIETSTRFNSVVWDLEKYGLASARTSVPSWPFLLVEPNIMSNNEHVCRIENDPYTPFREDYELFDVVKIDMLSNGNLVVLESQQDGINRLHLYNSRLEKINNGIGAAPLPNFLNSRIILDRALLHSLELNNGKWLAFVPSYKDQTIQYRAIVYDSQNDAILWSASEVLWEEPNLYYRDMKLLKLSDKKVLISYIDDSDYPNSHQQTIKFRILNLNF